jgi:hypothetical protein
MIWMNFFWFIARFWLILSTYDCHFFYIFLAMILTLATNKKKILEKTLSCCIVMRVLK